MGGTKVSDSGSKTYSYQSQHGSLLTPYLKQYVWLPILDKIPESLSPNALTVMGTLSCSVAFFSVLMIPLETPILFCIPALFTFAYMCFDNLDGAQARRTGQSSAFGEFLDHWFDTWNNGFVVLGICLAVGIPPFWTLVVQALTNGAVFASYWDHKHGGVFRTNFVGDVEGNTGVTLIYLLVAVLGQAALQVPIGHELLMVRNGLIVSCAASMGLTMVMAAVRTRRRFDEWFPYLLTHGALLGLYVSGQSSFAQVAALMFVGNVVCAGQPVLDRLLEKRSRAFDSLISFCALMAFMLSFFVPHQHMEQHFMVVMAMFLVLKGFSFELAVAKIARPSVPKAPG